MICINETTFEIAEDVLGEDFTVLPGWFQCDDMIAETISLLNTKGYKTEFCCQGHISTSGYDYVNNIFHPEIIVSTPYITFSERYEFESLPEGWDPVDHEGEILEYPDGTEVEDHRISIYYDKISNDYMNMNMIFTGLTMNFYDELVVVMRRLLEWAISLPMNNKE